MDKLGMDNHIGLSIEERANLSSFKNLDKDIIYDEIGKIAHFIKERAIIYSDPTVGIICGSGLYAISDIIEVDKRVVIPYTDIPGIPTSKVVGHTNSVILGKVCNTKVICFQGRCHFYEGYPMWKVTLPIRVMKLMGVRTVFVTNCCGGVNPEYVLGDIIVIKDHVSMPGIGGFNPLIGENDPRWGTRFPHLFDAYDKGLRKQCAIAYKDLGMRFREGVFCMFSGPSYQTRAEGKMVHLIGGDAVGMSTAPEAVIANHCGIKVCALALIASRMDYYENISYDSDEIMNGDLDHKQPQQYIDHDGVIAIGHAGAIKMAGIIKFIIQNHDLD